MGVEQRSDETDFAQQAPVLIRKTGARLLVAAAALLIVAIGYKALGQRLEHFVFFAQIKIHASTPSPFYGGCLERFYGLGPLAKRLGGVLYLQTVAVAAMRPMIGTPINLLTLQRRH